MFGLFESESGKTQKQIVLEMFQSGKELQPKDFINKYILRYGAHIFNLRKEGHNIVTRMEVKRNKIGDRISSVHPYYSLTK